MTKIQQKACGKNRYATEGAAIRSAIRASRRSGLALRVYRCPACQGFHLTKRAVWSDSPRIAAADIGWARVARASGLASGLASGRPRAAPAPR